MVCDAGKTPGGTTGRWNASSAARFLGEGKSAGLRRVWPEQTGETAHPASKDSEVCRGVLVSPRCCCPEPFLPLQTPTFLRPLPLQDDFFLYNNASAGQVQTLLLEKERGLRVYTSTLCEQVTRSLGYMRRRGRKKERGKPRSF